MYCSLLLCLCLLLMCCLFIDESLDTQSCHSVNHSRTTGYDRCAFLTRSSNAAFFCANIDPQRGNSSFAFSPSTEEVRPQGQLQNITFGAAGDYLARGHSAEQTLEVEGLNLGLLLDG